MFYSLPHDIGIYLYDVFVGRFDLWVGFGVVAQMMFAGRFLVQWIESERAGRSVIPVSFWILSIVGGGMTLIYGLVRHDAIIILGQVLSNVIYVRNLVLIAKNKRSSGAEDTADTNGRVLTHHPCEPAGGRVAFDSG